MNLQSWLLPLIPTVPGVAAALLAVLGRRISGRLAGWLATLSVLVSLLAVLHVAYHSGGRPELLYNPMAWLTLGGGENALLRAAFGLRLDALGLLMTLLVAGFGTLIVLYSIQYLDHDENPQRYFASIALFVSAMLTLVLADNLFLLFLGWEGVGLCSYLLIGHYWKMAGAPRAAFRAFFVNRIGDAFFLLAALVLFQALGTVNFADMRQNGLALDALSGEEVNDQLRLAALLLLGGAFGKSAQIPLHVWLPDAMAGPTPVSALIHAATMVTAGVYLLTRMDWLIAFSPEATGVLMACALATLALGALLAIYQDDIKKVLAYSTLSNLGLMFLAVAAGSSASGMLHVFGHAAFKALLFLAAGSVIYFAHHEQSLKRLRGILKRMPVTRAAFWIGALGAAGTLPFASAAFFSKESVLGAISEAHFALPAGIPVSGGLVYWIVFAVELLTILYVFRLLGYLEAGDGAGHSETRESGWQIRAVLIALTIFAPVFGIVSSGLGFPGGDWLYASLQIKAPGVHGLALYIALTAAGLAVFAGFASANLRERLQGIGARFAGDETHGPFARNFYFDDLYRALFVRPTETSAEFSRAGLEEPLFAGFLDLAGELGLRFSRALMAVHRGLLNHYALTLALASALLAGLVFFVL